MSITGSGMVYSYLESQGLIWTSYSGYFNVDVNFFLTAATSTGSLGAYRGTSTDFTSTSTATNGNWDNSSGSPDNFSIQWVGYFLASETGTYNWKTVCDDNSYLWIGPNAKKGYTTDNAILYNNSGTNNSSSLVLTAGVYYPIRIQYGDAGAANSFSMYFTLPGSSTQIYNGAGYYFNDGTLLNGVILNPSTTIVPLLYFQSTSVGGGNTITITTTNSVKTSANGSTIYTFTNTSATGTFTVSGNVNAHILIVGGGGAGGYDGGGGGGAGGLLDIASVSLTTKTYNINIGIGALGSNATYNVLSNGSNTTFDTLYTAYGGGGGYPLHSNIGASTGGSGGGASSYVGSGVTGPGLGTSGQGYNGGTNGGPSYNAGAGGGGASQAGYPNSVSVGGAGGNGYTSNISGTTQTYAGGGGGGCWNGTGAAGGLGGGGNGGSGQSVAATSGSYYGAGGGGAGYGGFGVRNGYQGIVIISIPTNLIANP